MISPFVTDKKNYLILMFTIAYLAAFTFNGIRIGNLEFLYYTFLLFILIYITIHIHQRLHLGFFILFNLSIMGFLHLLGGNIYFDHLRLYDWYLVPGLIRYDNIVHSYATYIITLALYSLLINFVAPVLKKRFFVFAMILVLMAIGMGSIVEIAEFMAVLFFNAQDRVGDYYNNSWDLIFNIIGSILATVVLYFYEHRPKLIQKINGTLNQNYKV